MDGEVETEVVREVEALVVRLVRAEAARVVAGRVVGRKVLREETGAGGGSTPVS